MENERLIPNGSINKILNPKLLSSNIALNRQDPYIMENRNWLIYYHFSRNEFEVCKLIIKDELEKTKGKAEFSSYVKGMILRHEGKIQESLDCFQRCYGLNPKNDDTMKQVARSLYLLGRQRLALEAFTEAKAVARKPEWDVYHNLGLCLINMGELVKGKELLRQAIQLNRHESSFFALARVHVAEGDITGSIEIYRTATEVYPDSVDLAVALALLYMDIGDHQKAFEKFGTALALDATCARALLAVGALMQGHGELDVALAKYKTAAGYIPESPSLWNNLGMCFFGKKRWVSAVSCLKRASALAPFDWKILLNLGLVHLATQQYASAFHYLSSAVNLDPTSGAVFLPLAVTLVHLGDRKNAKYAFEEAIASGVNSAAAAANYALFLLEDGDETGARIMYKKFQTQAERVPGIEPEVVDLATKLRNALQIPATTAGKEAAPSTSGTQKAKKISPRSKAKKDDEKLPDEV